MRRLDRETQDSVIDLVDLVNPAQAVPERNRIKAAAAYHRAP